MASFHIAYPDSKTVDRTLHFLNCTFAYQWNRRDMRVTDFREQVLALYPDLNISPISGILDSLSYYNDDISVQIGTLSDIEQQIKAEEIMLGAAIANPDSMAVVIDTLQAADFVRPRHQALFKVIASLYRTGYPVDFITILDDLCMDELFPNESEAKVMLAQLVQGLEGAAGETFYFHPRSQNREPECVTRLRMCAECPCMQRKEPDSQ